MAEQGPNDCDLRSSGTDGSSHPDRGVASAAARLGSQRAHENPECTDVQNLWAELSSSLKIQTGSDYQIWGSIILTFSC